MKNARERMKLEEPHLRFEEGARGKRRGSPRPSPMKPLKRTVVLVVGGTVLAVGVALIVLPGPAFIVIPLGLAILAIEFAWAKRWLRAVRAILPLNSGTDASTARKRMTVQSLQRNVAFLLRQVRRTVLPKRKLM